MLAFPAAGACAELLLAAKKDEVYAGEVKNLLREVLERCVGAHALSQLLPELSAASALLYLALVLGRRQPQQTLGEEFCDVIRVTSGAAGAVEHVGAGRQLAWFACAVLPQYIAARSSGGWQSLAQLTWSPRERMEQQLRLRRANTAGESGASSQKEQQARGVSVQQALKAMDALVAAAGALATKVETEVFPASYEMSLACVRDWLQQAHLAVFYVLAKHLHLSNRLARVQYSFVRSELSPGINLSLLVRLAACG